MSSEAPLVRVEMEYADGTIQRLTGPPAEAWLEDVNSVIALASIRYGSPPLDKYPWEWTDKKTEQTRADLDQFKDYEGTD